MGFLPLQRMQERVRLAREDSDTAYFFNLLYFGEYVTKLTVVGLVSAIEDDRDRSRYRHLHRLVRADGVGEWADVLDDVLTGPTSQHLSPDARSLQQELTQRVPKAEWQHQACVLLAACLRTFIKDQDNPTAKIAARNWFRLFATLRNTTRGHGAPLGKACSAACPALQKSLDVVVANLGLFKRQWAYLHRNLSGKYKVVGFSGRSDAFEELKTSRSGHWEDGIYVHIGQPRQVQLLFTDEDLTDFHLPNGAFGGKSYEVISYATDTRSRKDSSPYRDPVSKLPDSETHGLGTLDVRGEAFSNMPSALDGYVARKELQDELVAVLASDRRPVVTITGRGGIGKTSLALHVLDRIASTDRYTAILWFSARDIDLLLEGPKVVRPQVKSQEEIAEDFIQLVDPELSSLKREQKVAHLAKSLESSPVGGPILFVFDNFETVSSPGDLYRFLEANVRNPNKVLITSRTRDFRGDFPIEVSGMTVGECDELIAATAKRLRVSGLMTPAYRDELYRESEGHPYVVKMLIGEVAKTGKAGKVKRIIADLDDILDALFERTFAGLTPAGRRLFLTLSNWRSVVPMAVMEAILLRQSNERMDVRGAVDELAHSSFAETKQSEADDQLFLSVPLVASEFGRRKLAVSPLKMAVDADTELLRGLGATQVAEIDKGITPRVSRFFGEIARRVLAGQMKEAEAIPMLQAIGRSFPPADLLVADLQEEIGTAERLEDAKASIRRYLERGPASDQAREAWQRLARLCNRTGDTVGEIHARVEMCGVPDTPYSDISAVANFLNGLIRNRLILDTDEKRYVAERLVRFMEDGLGEADATDCSRLAWLHLNLNNSDRAREIAELGYRMDKNNHYCRKLVDKLYRR